VLFVFLPVARTEKSQMRASDIQKNYVKASTAATIARCPVGSVYTALQRGDVEGICVDGSWLVLRKSAERWAAERSQTPAVATA
jgi:hypothetical protein